MKLTIQAYQALSGEMVHFDYATATNFKPLPPRRCDEHSPLDLWITTEGDELLRLESGVWVHWPVPDRDAFKQVGTDTVIRWFQKHWTHLRRDASAVEWQIAHGFPDGLLAGHAVGAVVGTGAEQEPWSADLKTAAGTEGPTPSIGRRAQPDDTGLAATYVPLGPLSEQRVQPIPSRPGAAPDEILLARRGLRPDPEVENMSIGTNRLVALNSLLSLKRQFEEGASRYPLLNHVHMGEPKDQPDVLKGPFPIEGFSMPEQALSGASGVLQLVCRYQEAGASKVGFQTRFRSDRRVADFFYLGEPLLHDQQTFTYYLAGVHQFKTIATIAGKCLLSLPELVHEIVPPDLASYRDQLFSTPMKIVEEPRAGNEASSVVEATIDVLYPPGKEADHRWIGFLHWFGWHEGEGSVLGSKRQTWHGKLILPWFATREDAESDCFFPWSESVTFESTRHYYSIVKNPFLTSALVIQAIESEAASQRIGSTGVGKVPKRHRKKRGRRPDTDAAKDKRIADDWRKGHYRTYKALADALNLTEREVMLAIDRDRHRPGSGVRRKPRQGPSNSSGASDKP